MLPNLILQFLKIVLIILTVDTCNDIAVIQVTIIIPLIIGSIELILFGCSCR
jgi:hypothetical protein